MKKAKWIISLFIFILSFVLSSELYQSYVGTFTNQYYYFDVSVVDDRSELYLLFTEYASEHDMGVFSVKKTNQNARYTEIIVFSTDLAKDKLKQNNVISGEKPSLLSGTTNIVIKDFSDIIQDESVERYYFTGSKNQVMAFRDYIYNYYATSYIHQEKSNGTEWLISAIWVISLLFILLLTWLDIQFQKKEIFIRLSLGSSVWKIIGKNVLADTVFSVCAFLASFFSLQSIIYLGYGLSLAIEAIVAFLFMNALLYLSLLKYDYKQILYGANINEQTLSTCYVLKAVTMIVAIASLSINIGLVSESVRYMGCYQDIAQYDRFSTLHISPAVNTHGDNYDEFSKIRTDIFLDYYRQGKVGFSLSCAEDPSGKPIITLTDTVNRLIANSEILDLLGDYDYHVFIPRNTSIPIDENVIDLALQASTSLFGQAKDSAIYEVVYYDGAEILYFDFQEGSKLSVGFDKVQNPIFVYCSLSDRQLENIVQNTDNLSHDSIVSLKALYLLCNI